MFGDDITLSKLFPWLKLRKHQKNCGNVDRLVICTNFYLFPCKALKNVLNFLLKHIYVKTDFSGRLTKKHKQKKQKQNCLLVPF